MWLAEAFVKERPTEKKLEMAHVPWISVDEEVLRLRETAALKWVPCVRPNSPHCRKGKLSLEWRRSIRISLGYRDL